MGYGNLLYPQNALQAAERLVKELRSRIADLETTANTRSKAQLAALEQKVRIGLL